MQVSVGVDTMSRRRLLAFYSVCKSTKRCWFETFQFGSDREWQFSNGFGLFFFTNLGSWLLMILVLVSQAVIKYKYKQDWVALMSQPY